MVEPEDLWDVGYPPVQVGQQCVHRRRPRPGRAPDTFPDADSATHVATGKDDFLLVQNTHLTSR